MKIDWRVVGTSEGHVLIEYTADLPNLPEAERSITLNIPIADNDTPVHKAASDYVPQLFFRAKLKPKIITDHMLYAAGSLDMSDEPQPAHNPDGIPSVTYSYSEGATLFRYKPGDILPTHVHKGADLHNIKLVKGRVVVTREFSGNILLDTPGQAIDVQLNEAHSVEAFEPSETLHTRYKT